MKLKPENKIIIAPIGSQDASLINLLGMGIEKSFKYPTESMRLLGDIHFAFDPARNQYYSTVILDRLAEAAPKNAIKIIAVVSKDLFIPIFTHVYGEAQLGGKACIVSIYRIREDCTNTPDLLSSRLLKEAIHELGHTFNLRHCPDDQCIMHYCRSLKDVDRKTEQFCRYCKIMLSDEISRLGLA
ncbi:MAG: archaemetzincin family Zn-dependent metalloprotease [Deltaproteobacteria bacterium]|nr:archaemetzincin family Zn-dependent metalloprotease [Deltaproteobacteria bacterium]